MKDTIIYLIRHAKTIDEDGIRNTNETTQEINEKEILSIESPCLLKLTFRKNELINLEQVK